MNLNTNREETMRKQATAGKVASATISGLIGAALLSSAAIAAQVSVGTAALVDPGAADSYYGPGSTSTVDIWSSGRPVELKELARALRNDVDLIYEFVRNNVEYVPMYGLQKGALGAVIDRSGTAFDQAHLMVELLRESGYTATYHAGTIQLDGTQVNSWLGTNNADAVRAILKDGGIPATVSGTTTVTSATIAHCWVQVTIGGTNYLFDPAYKPRAFASSIDLAAAMGWSESSFTATAQSTLSTGTQGTAPWVKNVNNAGMASTLDTYASNLLTYLRNNHANSELENVIGGGEITPAVIPTGGLRQTSLPYTATSLRTWTGNVPDQYRTKMTIQLISRDPPAPGITKLLYVDEVYGRRIIFETNPVLEIFNVNLMVDGVSKGTHSANRAPSVREHDVQFTINHPYAANAGAYMDGTFTSKADFALPVVVVNGWGKTTPNLLSKVSGEREHDDLVETRPPNGQGGEPSEGAPSSNGNHTRAKLGANWLAQFGKMVELQSLIANSVHQVHHAVGLAYADANVGYSCTVPCVDNDYHWIKDQVVRVDVTAAISLNNRQNLPAERKGAVHSIAAAASTIEGSLMQQMFDSPDSASTAERFKWANEASGLSSTMRFYLVDYAFNSTSPQYTYHDGQGDAGLQGELSAYVAGTTRAIFPNDSFLGPGNRFGAKQDATNWNPTFQRGSAFITFNDDGSNLLINHVITSFAFRDSHGGGAGVAPTYEQDFDPSEAANLLKDKFTDRSNLHGVSLQSGDLSFSPGADITVGNGGFPYELSLQRSFKAGATRTPGLASGWTHNLDIRADISGSGMDALGEHSVLNATGSLVAMYVTQQLYKSEPALAMDLLKRWVLPPFVQQWWTKHLYYNVVTINRGHSATQYFRLPDGSFNPPRGGLGTLVQSGQRQKVYKAYPAVPAGYPDEFHEWDASGVSFTLTHPSKEVQTFSYWHKGMNQTVDPYEKGKRIGWHLASWTFPYGMELTYTYNTSIQHVPDALTRVQNSIGRYIDFSYTGTSGDCYNLASATDGNSRTVTYNVTCSNAGTLNTVTLPNSEVHTYNYLAVESYPADARPTVGLKLTKVFSPGDATYSKMEVAYDKTWRVQTFKDAVAVKTPAQRNPYTFYVTGVHRGERIDPLGNEYTAYYDRRGRAVQFIDELGRGWNATHDAHDRVDTRIFPEGNSVDFDYDAKHNVTKVTQIAKSGSGLANIVIEATYDAGCNKIKTVTDPRLNVTTWNYNTTSCNLETVVQPAVPNPKVGGSPLQNPTTTFTYTSRGQRLTVTDPTGVKVAYTYHATNGNRETRTVDPVIDPDPDLALTTGYSYNAVGDITSVTDPRSNQATYQYDTLRRLTRIDAPLGSIVKNYYDADGNLWKFERAKVAGPVDGNPAHWQTTTSTFSPTGKPLVVTDPEGNTVTTSYDQLDRDEYVTQLVESTPAVKNRVTRNEYDAAGQLLKIYRAWGSTDQITYATYAYTLNGQQDWFEDANGNRTDLVYDGHDRVSQMQFPSVTLHQASTSDYEEYTYDPAGNRLTKRNRSSKMLTFVYDALNRETTRNVPANYLDHFARTLTSSYDLASRKWDVAADGQTLKQRYDDAGRLTSVEDTLIAATVGYTYDAASNRTRVTWPDAYYVQYTYDALNRMDLVQESGTATLADYIYDTLSRRDFTTFGNGVTSDYSYENDDDLSGILHSASAGTLNYGYGRNHAHQLKNQTLTETFAAYTDATFFWKPAGASSSAYVPNHLNQYATVAGTAQGYDANGNLTGDGTYMYEYDEENRLRSATSAGTTVTYTYDPAGRRSSRTVNSTVTRFLSDGAEEIGEYTGANALLRRFVYGAAIDDRIAMVEAGGARSYYQVNHQGSTVLLTNQSGAVTETYKYGAYGESTDPVTGNPYRYTGRRLDPETNLYYYRARYYSTALGRFLQTDPIGAKDDLNLYAYVGNNPLNATDPLGMAGKEDSGGGNGSDSDSAKQQNEVSGPCARSNNCQVMRFHERVADSGKGTPREAQMRAMGELLNPDRWGGPEVSGTLALGYGPQASLGADSQTLDDGTLSLQGEFVANEFGGSVTASVASFRLGNPEFDSHAASATLSAGLVDIMKNTDGDWAVDVHIGVTFGMKGKVDTGPSVAAQPVGEVRVPLRLRPACFPGECSK